MTDAARVLQVLGDDSRRAIFELVAAGEASVGEIAEAVSLRQPTVSQHLKVLHEAGVVARRAEGNRRLYRVDLDGLAALRAYLDRFWDDALDAFATYADDPRTDPARPPAPSGRSRKDPTP